MNGLHDDSSERSRLFPGEIDNGFLGVSEDDREGGSASARDANRHHSMFMEQIDGLQQHLRADLKVSTKFLSPSSEKDSPTSPGEVSFIDNAANDDDLDAIKEGLSFALGTNDNGGKWLPISDNKSEHSRSTDSEYVSPESPFNDQNEGYIENIPMDNLRPRSRSILGDTLQVEDTTHSLFRSSTGHSAGSASGQESFKNGEQLEAGTYRSRSNDHYQNLAVPSSPSKFTDVIARVSDRIAGSGGDPANGTQASQYLNVSNKQKKSPSLAASSARSSPKAISLDDSHNQNMKVNMEDTRSIPELVVNSADEESVSNSFKQASKGLGLYSNRHESKGFDTAVPDSPISNVNISIGQTVADAITSPRKGKPFVSNDPLYLYGNSLKLFPPKSKLRQFCYKVSSSKSSNLFLLILLVLQVALLSYRQWNPLALNGYMKSGYNWADYILIIINVIYTVEIIFKIIAYGLVDDTVMYETLGLPCPEGSIRKSFRLKYFQRAVDALRGLGVFKSSKPGRRYSPFKSNKSNFDNFDPRNSSEDSDVREVDLDADINEKPKIYKPFGEEGAPNWGHDLRKKYSTHTSHYRDFIKNNEDDRIELSAEPLSRTQILNSKNTFIKPTTPDVSKLNLKRSYLRNSWHRIDFFSMVMFWISLLISIDHYDAKKHITLFRALSCLRILRLCNLTNGTTTILTACKVALPQLFDVSIFICCFWLFFGIIGVQSFKSSLTRHCVWTNPNDPNDTFVNSDQYCGSYMSLEGMAMSFIDRNGKHSHAIKGYRCPKYSKCVSGDNPYGGTVNFDNIFQSMEMVFVVMSANTFTDIMYDTMDTDNLAACLFFIFGIFILTVWLINVFIAVIVASFNVTRFEVYADKQRPGYGKRIWSWLGFSNDPSKHIERLNCLKRRSTGLRIYYRFEFLFPIIIFVDLFVQCFRKNDMSKHRASVLYRFEAAFTLVFLIEILIRLFLHFPNWRMFFSFKRNCFDLFLAAITSIIVLNPVKEKLGHAYYWLTVFQLMRFYRVVLATSLTRNLWLKIIGNIRAIIDIALFYFILTYLCSIVLARYFEGFIPQDSLDDVDFPMQTLPNAFIALYVITSTENWTDILYGLQQYAHSTSSRVFGAIFLIAWFVISNSVILNIFIAVIAKALEVSEEGKRKQQLFQFIENMTKRIHNMKDDSSLLMRIKNKVLKKQGVTDDLERAVVNLLLSGTAVNDFLGTADKNMDDNDDVKNLSGSGWKRKFQVWTSRVTSFFRNPFYTRSKKEIDIVENFDPATFAKTIVTERKALISKQNKFLVDNPRFNDVFYVMGPRHRLRRFCQRLVKPSHGERINGVEANRTVSEAVVVIMFLATIGLVVTACYFTPLFQKEVQSKYGRNNWTFYVELSFNVLFTLEFLIKVIADGFLFTPNAYMRSSWNHLDLVVLLSLWMDFIAFMKNDANLSRIVRGLKALRALRILTISETAKNNFHNTIITGFWKIINAAMISLCLLYPFSIWGLNIFNGRLGYCLDGVSYESECFNEYENEVFNWNVLSPNVYTNPPLEFNRFATAFSTLFQIVSLEGWVDLLLNLMKSRGKGVPPEDFASPFNGFFLILFNFTSIVFILTLFVSVIISNYSKTSGRAYMTRDQISWYSVKKFLVQVRPSNRKNLSQMGKFRRFAYQMTVEKNPHWNRGVSFVLLLHIIALLLECFPTYDGLDTVRYVIVLISSVVFTANAFMLMFAQGFHRFIEYKWNVINIVVSIGALTTNIASFFFNGYSPFRNINKLFLVCVLAFVLPKSNRLSQLLRFASAGLPSLISLLFTWGVIFLVFAIAMNQIFGTTKIGPNSSDNINLRSVPKALILLFRCSFGEGWNYIMDDFALEEPYCTAGSSFDDNDCGNKQYAYILFIAWNIISMYIFLNMFISLILDSFSYINQKSEYGHLMERQEIRKFKKSWQKFDPEGTGYIKPYQLPKLLRTLDGSLSFHLYYGILDIPKLTERWIKRNSPNDPYDITYNIDALEQIFSVMNIPKIREKRMAYERFIEEAIMNMELNSDPGISFTRILLQLPLYTAFEEGQCLHLIDFLERRLLLQKVEKRLKKKRIYETIAAYACRWKYKRNQMHGIRDADINFGETLRRNSYLLNEEMDIKTPSINIQFDDDESNPFRDPDDSSLHPRDNMEVDDVSFDGKVPSSIYEPKSPVHIYRATPNMSESDEGRLRHPKLFIQVPKQQASLGSASYTDEYQISPLRENETEEGDPSVALIDLSTVGETLENSSWAEAFNEMKSSHSNGEKGTDKNKQN